MKKIGKITKKKRTWRSQDMASRDEGSLRVIKAHSDSYTGQWGHPQTYAIKLCACLPDVFACFQTSCIAIQIHLGIYQ